MIMVPAPQESLGDLEEKARNFYKQDIKSRALCGSHAANKKSSTAFYAVLRTRKSLPKLNLSERTVKFHASSLLAKFKVRAAWNSCGKPRASPMQLLPAAVSPPAPQMPPFARRPNLYAKPMHSRNVCRLARPRLMA